MERDVETNKTARKPSSFVYLAAASALLGAIAMGNVLGWTAQAVPDMSDVNSSKPLLNLTTPRPNAPAPDGTVRDWISSSATLGALVGALISGPMAQIIGRKTALILYGIPMISGFTVLWLANSKGLVIVGRVLSGLSAGLVSGTAPAYVVEISTENIRGMLGTGFQLCVTIGILMSFVVGAFTPWNWFSFICIFPGLAMSVLMIFMPETPIWLMTKSGGDHSKGSKVAETLALLRSDTNDNETELVELAESTQGAQTSMNFKWSDTKNTLFYKPFVLAMFLMFFQQFSGINAVMFNATNMLTEAGSTVDPKYGAIMIGVAQVLATLCGAFLIDRLGRKKLLLISSAGHAISLAILGLNIVTGVKAGWIPVVCLVIFIISFSLGWGPIPWVMITEITPMQFRGVISAMSTALNWICAFFITHFYKGFQESTSQQFLFFFFAFFCLLSIPFVYLFLPETKGKTNAEILKILAKKEGSDDNTPQASNSMLKGANKGNVAGLNNSDNTIEMKGFNEKK